MRKKIKKAGWQLPGFIASLAVIWLFMCFYVFLYCKIVAIGYSMEESKKQFEELNMLNKNHKAELLGLTSADNLLRRAEDAQLGLTSPSHWCFVDIKPDVSRGKGDGTAEAGTD